MTTGGTVALGLVLGVVSLLCVLAAGALLVAAAVAGLVPVAGTAGALAVVAVGLLAVVGLAAGTMAAVLRRARARRQARTTLPIAALLEVTLAVLPRRRIAQLEAALLSGVALGTLVLGLIGKVRAGSAPDS